MKDWRKINGIWHWTEHFPEAFRYKTFCGLYKAYDLFQKISKEPSLEENICPVCFSNCYEKKGKS